MKNKVKNAFLSRAQLVNKKRTKKSLDRLPSSQQSLDNLSIEFKPNSRAYINIAPAKP